MFVLVGFVSCRLTSAHRDSPLLIQSTASRHAFPAMRLWEYPTSALGKSASYGVRRGRIVDATTY